MRKFIYQKSRKIRYWGCGFDSLLELKFALSIKDEYQFLRSHIPIYYDPRSRMPTYHLRAYIRRYTPDFLIRHTETREAFLVEIKPSGFSDEGQLQLRTQVAENYIRWMHYDWKFKIVYESDIVLRDDLQDKLYQCSHYEQFGKRKMKAKSPDNRLDRTFPTLFLPPSNSKVRFVMFGTDQGRRTCH